MTSRAQDFGHSGIYLLGLGYAFLSLLPGTVVSQILYVLFDGVDGECYMLRLFSLSGATWLKRKNQKSISSWAVCLFCFSNLI